MSSTRMRPNPASVASSSDIVDLAINSKSDPAAASPTSSTAEQYPRLLHNRNVMQSPWQRLMFLTIILFVVLVGVLHLTEVAFLDECAIDRFAPMKELSFLERTLLSRAVLTNWTIVSIFTCCVLLITWPASMISNGLVSLHWENSFALTFAVAWYHGTQMLCTALKHVFDDRLCSRHPNSISGHYTLYIFSTLTMMFVAVRSKRDPHNTSYYFSSQLVHKLFVLRRFSIRAVLFVTCEVLLVIVSLLNAYITYVHGYHTPRQIFYGIMFGLASHLGFTICLSQNVSFLNLVSKRHTNSVLILIGFIAVCVVLFCRYVGVALLLFGPFKEFLWISVATVVVAGFVSIKLDYQK